MNKLRKSISFLLAVTLTFFQPIVPLKAADVLNSDTEHIEQERSAIPMYMISIF